MAKGSTTYLQYDGRKERVYKDVGGSKTLYLRGSQEFPIMVKNGSTEILYAYGLGGAVAVRVDGTWHYVLSDHLGSTRVVVNGSGAAVSRYDYDPYGKIVASAENIDPKYKFTGQELDFAAIDGLWNFRARLYDNEIGLFYATDPAYQTWSPMGYASGNPISFVDPDGRYGLNKNKKSADNWGKLSIGSSLDQHGAQNSFPDFWLWGSDVKGGYGSWSMSSAVRFGIDVIPASGGYWVWVPPSTIADPGQWKPVSKGNDNDRWDIDVIEPIGVTAIEGKYVWVEEVGSYPMPDPFSAATSGLRSLVDLVDGWLSLGLSNTTKT